MANMDAGQRIQMDRAELGHTKGSRMMTTRSTRAVTAYTLIAVPIAAALVYAVVAGIDHWYQALVLGVLVVIFFGLAAWVHPDRKHV